MILGPSSRERVRVLLVEDHPISRNALSRSLRRRAAVDEAVGIDDGSVLLSSNRYDVVVVDEVLGQASGRSLLRRIAPSVTGERPRRVLMSGYLEPRGSDRPYEYFVQKPDDVLWLLRNICEIGAPWRRYAGGR